MYLTREKAGQILKLNYGFQSESLTFSITAVLKKKKPDAQELTNQYLDKMQKSLGDDLLIILQDERFRENKDVIEGMFLQNYQTKEISKIYQCIHLDIVHLTIKNTQKIKEYETVYIQESKHHFKEEIILESNKINLTFRKEDKEANLKWVFFDQIESQPIYFYPGRNCREFLNCCLKTEDHKIAKVGKQYLNEGYVFFTIEGEGGYFIEDLHYNIQHILTSASGPEDKTVLLQSFGWTCSARTQTYTSEEVKTFLNTYSGQSPVLKGLQWTRDSFAREDELL